MAGFIGTSNLLDLRVDERATGVLAMRLGDSHRILAPDDGQPAEAPRQITVRPEKIKLSADGLGGEVSRVHGTVADVVYLGSMTQIIVELPSGERLVVHRLNDDLSAKQHEVGTSIELYWACDHSFVIGSGTELPVGRRLSPPYLRPRRAPRPPRRRPPCGGRRPARSSPGTSAPSCGTA